MPKQIPKTAPVVRADNCRVEGECITCKKKKIQDDSLIFKKLDFVLFIADVINKAAQTSSRMDRIRIIVKSAKKFLNVQGLEWGRIIESLNEPDTNTVEEFFQSQSCSGPY